MSEFASDKKADPPSSSTSNPTSIPFVQTRAVPASQVGTLTAADLRKPDGSSLPLDWTNMGVGADDDCHPLRLPIDVVDQDAFDPEDDHLAIIGTSGHKVTKIGGLEDLKLRVVCLRSHLIEAMEGLGCFSETLEQLELYDNQISALEQLDKMPKLTSLDMSFNVIRSMAPVAHCVHLTELYIANNKLTKIEGLEGLVKLKTLDVGANRLRSMEGVGSLVSLEHLWMGKNKITEICDLDNLKKLRRLDIQSNRLTRVENLAGLVDCLEELYLASNGIDDAGLALDTGLQLFFEQLNVLDLSKNKIKELGHFSHLTGLDELWISENLVSEFDTVKTLAPVGLECLYLEHNPVSSDFEYRKKLKEMLPSLKQIDANAIGQQGRGAVGGGLIGEGVRGFGMAAMTDAERVKVMQILQQQAIEKAKRETEEKA
eukprot:CAMPEP_0197565836 /NCGR_PEP_ID=MMETSP1320-20131121/32842_1 /TAXON_ID=91990 /ORGANISM="Bolidomonas sp., Strain RCC2347" /LENGTH=428 /DNA_ID=CAMNT_0043127857 /DNA_START=74 /DNA_END=1356 /DNA_ORIENTATION=+